MATTTQTTSATLEKGGAEEAGPLFDLPVDSECKAKKIKIYSAGLPHMRAFHLSWIAFFFSFLATFAPAALMPVIRENLNMDKWEIGNSGVAAVVGAIAARLFMGAFMDVLGPRLGTAGTLLIVSPAVFCMSMVTSSEGFLAVRLVIGMSLCCFVCCQFWVGSMFSVNIVGTANAITAGWGNMGGGVTALIMPLIYEGIKGYVPGFEAWRWSFFVPGGLYILTGLLVLFFSQDTPLGDYRTLKKSGKMAKGKGNTWAVLKCGLGNYRAWILLLTYGYSFGVELAVDNIIVQYLYDQFEMDLATAGGLGALFGMMNIFSRASGGMLSDLVALKFGMRGRLWALWIIQTLGGAFCLVMGYVDYSLSATIVVMVIFSIFCQQACGAHFGIAPFISRRAYGIVSGMIGAGGNAGGAIVQAIFFKGSKTSPNLATQDGLIWMGVMIMGMTMLLFLVEFPMWGSMLTRGRETVSEHDYYLAEWSPEEVAAGLHNMSMRFADESRSQRMKSVRLKQLGSQVSDLCSMDSSRKPASMTIQMDASRRGAKGESSPSDKASLDGGNDDTAHAGNHQQQGTRV